MAKHSFYETALAATPDAAMALMDRGFRACGWELHDDWQSNRKVYRSNGEDGRNPYGYVDVYAQYAYNVYFYVYQWWDKVSHTGVGKIGVDGSWNYVTNLQANPLFVVGSKDGILFSAGDGQRQPYIGFLPEYFVGQKQYARLTSQASAGSNVVCEVHDSSDFQVGNRVQYVGYNGGAYRSNVVAIPDGTHITLADLAIALPIGSVICDCYTFGGSIRGGNSYHICFGGRDYSGTGNCTNTYDTYQSSLRTGDSDPDSAGSGRYLLGKTKSDLYLGSVVCGLDPDLFRTQPNIGANTISYWAEVGAGPYEAGTAEGGGATGLADNDKAWTVDQWIGHMVTIISGTGAGQCRRITANTTTELTVNRAWEVAPGADSIYVVTEKVFSFRGNLSHFTWRYMEETLPA